MTPEQQNNWFLAAARYATTRKVRMYLRRRAAGVRKGTVKLFQPFHSDYVSASKENV